MPTAAAYEQERTAARERRLKLLNDYAAKVALAIAAKNPLADKKKKLSPHEPTWGELTAAVKCVVMELRHEYRGLAAPAEQEEEPAESTAPPPPAANDPLAAIRIHRSA